MNECGGLKERNFTERMIEGENFTERIMALVNNSNGRHKVGNNELD